MFACSEVSPSEAYSFTFQNSWDVNRAMVIFLNHGGFHPRYTENQSVNKKKFNPICDVVRITFIGQGKGRYENISSSVHSTFSVQCRKAASVDRRLTLITGTKWLNIMGKASSIAN